MQLDVKEVADLFRVPEQAVYRWVDRSEIPHFRVNDRYRFNRAELLEWASQRKICLCPTVEGATALSVREALRNGGIYYGVESRSQDLFLRRMINLLPLPERVDRDFAFQTIRRKPCLGLTGVGDGLVVPHLRHPMVAEVPAPMLTLCFSAAGLPLNIPENGGDTAVFFLVSGDVHMHQRIVSRLAFLLENRKLRQLLLKQASAGEIIAAFGNAEKDLPL